MLAPIIIFAYNRPDALCRLKESLIHNDLFNLSECHIYVDGCRNEPDRPKVDAVIKIAKEMTDNVIISTINNGLAKSVISGITDVISEHGKAIVLEDDLVCSSNFLSYMNQALDIYENNPQIISVCAYGLKIRKPRGYIGDVYLSNRSSSWGWGTWKNRWENIDWDIKDWNEFKKNKKIQNEFNRGGSDMSGMLKKYMRGENQSWAIRFCYNQFRQKQFSVCPFLSKTDNIGFGESATNCKQQYSRFKVELDMTASNEFIFPTKLEYNENIARQLRFYHSVPLRIYSKLRKLLNL